MREDCSSRWEDSLTEDRRNRSRRLLLRRLDEYAAVAGAEFLKWPAWTMTRWSAGCPGCFRVQPSVGRRQVRKLEMLWWVAHDDALLVLGPPSRVS